MGQLINIHPITRIEGHASIAIQLDDQGEVRDSKVRILSLRGFEKFVEGKPAEELPRGSVQVQGSQLAVEALQPDQVHLVIEGETIRRAGSWTLATRPEVPSSVTVLDWSPKEMTMQFSAGSR